VPVDINVDVDVNSEGRSHSDDWSRWEQWGHDWASYYEDDEYRLDVFDTLDELKEHIPEELYEAIVRHVNGEDVEILDI
jgi:EXLDI family protein